ncbi:MBL fold metallo-hydrolase [Methylophaga sp.]|uniref:MBL fold metallo-hydrolase n=1 Tax=Methylophaga sp. TaxID=2024840 RepID=UPI0025FFF73E|nr:MBL fold metallo-hydrolase [Methylophaga sp.]
MMKQIQSDLWETSVESPFPGLTTHAYLWIRDNGNVLFYNTSQQNEIQQMAALGGVAYQLLSHRDELGGSINQIRDLYAAKLGGHRAELEAFAEVCQPDIVFEQRQWLFDDLEVIPTPGHTPGSCCFLAKSSEGSTVLFTGDTLYWSDTGLRPGLLPFSDRDQLIQSLSVLETVSPDLVCSSAFSGQDGFKTMGGDWAEQLAIAKWLLEQQS